MGITPKYNEKNPPPFHLNVNNPISYGYPAYNNPYNNYSKYEPKINNPEISKKKLKKEEKKKNEDMNNNFKTEPILENKEIEVPKEKLKNNDFSIDINILTKDIVEVKIPIEGSKNKIWKKEYNKKELIGTVINDYLIENKLNLPDDYFSQLKCFNKPVSFQDEIESLLPKEIENKKEDKIYPEILYPDIIGKPFYNPFEILCFYKNQKKFITLNYNKIEKVKTNIDNFNKTSAYCNGYNHLYISGGENSLNNFWDINLKKNIINSPINDMPPKKNHSMIFIPNNIIFIVGGNSLSTFYYDIKEKKMIKWGKLNIIRIEPALQYINNRLYCFDCTNLKEKKNEYSYEFTDLDSNNGNKWEFIKPKINYDLWFNQQLFGVAKDKNNNIIFLGGIFDGININEENNKIKNFMLDINKNEIILSDIKYKKFNLKERGFFPFNNKYDCILTDFDRFSPQICFFNKKKSKLDLINFASNENMNNISPVFPFNKNETNENKTNLGLGLRNPNLNKKYNTINQNNNINYNYANNNINNNNINYTGRNTVNITPDKNFYRIKKLNFPNTDIYKNERNHSVGSKKYYYPNLGLKTNKNIYKFYKSKYN